MQMDGRHLTLCTMHVVIALSSKILFSLPPLPPLPIPRVRGRDTYISNGDPQRAWTCGTERLARNALNNMQPPPFYVLHTSLSNRARSKGDVAIIMAIRALPAPREEEKKKTNKYPNRIVLAIGLREGTRHISKKVVCRSEDTRFHTHISGAHKVLGKKGESAWRKINK